MKEISVKIHNKIYELSVPYLIAPNHMLNKSILFLFEDHKFSSLQDIDTQLHTSYYHCPACKLVTTRESNKKWIDSWCDVMNVSVRMKFIKHFE